LITAKNLPELAKWMRLQLQQCIYGGFSALSAKQSALCRLKGDVIYIYLYKICPKAIYRAMIIDVIMVKTEKQNNENTNQTNSLVLASACMDCLFWYRCRGGKLDCLFRAPLAQTNGVRA
jgi:hypothetical protein